MLKSHLAKRTKPTLAATLLLAGGVLASMLFYASGPAAESPAGGGASELNYRVGMVLRSASAAG